MAEKVAPMTMSYDAEKAFNETETPFYFSEKSIRLGFIRKVFAITTIQLLVTISFIALFFFTPSIANFAQESVAMLACSTVLTFVLSIVFACCENARRRTPWNYVLLITFTLAMSWMVAVITSYYTAESVLWAAGITAIITVGLVCFSLQTRLDFTYLSGILLVLLFSLIGFGIFAIIFRSRILEAVYAGIGAVIFGMIRHSAVFVITVCIRKILTVLIQSGQRLQQWCIYIVIDVQMMMGGHHYSLSAEEYIFAALNLYLDIINLFLKLLVLFGKKR